MPPADWTPWFRPDYAGAPFVTLGRAHLWSLALLVVFGALMLRFRGADETTRRRA